MEEGVAGHLNVGLLEASEAVVAVADRKMAEAVRLMTVARGVDPRTLSLIGAGGASGLHVCNIAELLGIRRVVIPVSASVFCAYGLLHADIERRFATPVAAPLAVIGSGRLKKVARDLRREGVEAVAAAGLDPDEAEFTFAVGMRYEGEQAILRTTASESSMELDDGAIERAFVRDHELLYGFARPGDPIEVSVVELTVTNRVGHPAVTLGDRGPAKPARCVRETTMVLSAEVGPQAVQCYEWEGFTGGEQIAGPGLVFGINTAVLVRSGWSVEVDGECNLMMDRKEEA
jgi:N-methylhydantoinase A/oxoprolinase/acetone carboxylase beta subunit